MHQFYPVNMAVGYRMFPLVTHFTLSSDEMNSFLQSLDEQTYKDPVLGPPVTSPLWPKLHTRALHDRPKDLNITSIQTLVSARIALDHPIQKLQLSKPIMFMLEDEMQWLWVHVEVEEYMSHLGLVLLHDGQVEVLD